MADSLMNYARKNPTHKGTPCWVCSQTQIVEVEENGNKVAKPVIDFINSGLKQGLYPTQIREWLINELGYNVQECTATRLANHKQRRHHEIPT
jgi:hypothetical protein